MDNNKLLDAIIFIVSAKAEVSYLKKQSIDERQAAHIFYKAQHEAYEEMLTLLNNMKHDERE